MPSPLAKPPASPASDRPIAADSTDTDCLPDVGVCVPNPSAPAVEQPPKQSEDQTIAKLYAAGFVPPQDGYIRPPDLRSEWIVAGTVGALLALIVAGFISYRQSRMYPPPPPASAVAEAEGKVIPKPSAPSIYDKAPDIVTVDVTGSSASASPSSSASSPRANHATKDAAAQAPASSSRGAPGNSSGARSGAPGSSIELPR